MLKDVGPSHGAFRAAVVTAGDGESHSSIARLGQEYLHGPFIYRESLSAEARIESPPSLDSDVRAVSTCVEIQSPRSTLKDGSRTYFSHRPGNRLVFKCTYWSSSWAINVTAHVGALFSPFKQTSRYQVN